MRKDPQTNEYHIEKRTKLDKFREQQDIDDLPVEDFKIDQIQREDEKYKAQDRTKNDSSEEE